MRLPASLAAATLAGTLLAAPAAAQQSAPPASPAASAAATTLFRAVRVFDGARLVGRRDVLVQGGRIARVAPSITAPAGAVVVEGVGRTLLPGLIDAHTHGYGDDGRAALAFGVTTELDMFTDVATMRQRHAEQAAGKADGRADLLSAGTLVTAPGGHGTEYGLTIPTLASADSAQAFVDARLAEGSDWIKIVYDDGHAFGIKWGNLDSATMHATIAAARRRDRLAVVHVSYLAGARTAIGAGAHGLVHLFTDSMPDAGFARLVAARRAFVIPTLTVLASIAGTSSADVVRDARLAPFLTRNDARALSASFPRTPGGAPRSYAAAEAAVRQLRAAGVPILAGTDAGNPGTSHGAALHRELELLVRAGLTPAEALAAATGLTARHFRLADRGRIAPGLRADLLLVEGDPTADVTATRAIVGVWKAGVAMDRAAYSRAAAATHTATAAVPPNSESGDVADFEDGGLTSRFGAGWMPSDDGRAGGGSKVAMRVVDGGAEGTAKSLEIAGTIDGKLPYAWAGAMFSPGATPFAPANLTRHRELRFRARGDGTPARVMLFAESKGGTPLVQSFTPGAEWQEFSLPLAAFGGTDGRDIMAILFVGGPRPGAFSFRIDDVRLR